MKAALVGLFRNDRFEQKVRVNHHLIFTRADVFIFCLKRLILGRFPARQMPPPACGDFSTRRPGQPAGARSHLRRVAFSLRPRERAFSCPCFARSGRVGAGRAGPCPGLRARGCPVPVPRSEARSSGSRSPRQRGCSGANYLFTALTLM